MNNILFSFDPRLDSAFLQSMYEGDVEYAREIFSMFVEMAPDLVKDIDESFALGTVEPLRLHVHKLKPAFSFVGLTKLAKIAEALEERCKETSDIIDIKDLYNELKNNYTLSFPIIEKEMERLKNQINQCV
ncbi:MAG TPA: Hpt domain-containing protein [Hanamia sp.]|nr:Hpt domain-containing protein [Hanamia sp.]